MNLVGYAPDAPTRRPTSTPGWATAARATTRPSRATRSTSTTWAPARRRPVGKVTFWKASGADVFGYNLTRSAVWNVDFSGVHQRPAPTGWSSRASAAVRTSRSRRRLRESLQGLDPRLLLHAHRAGQPDRHLAAAAHAALHPGHEPGEHRGLPHDHAALPPRLGQHLRATCGTTPTTGRRTASPATRPTPTPGAATPTPPTGTATSATSRSSTTCCCPTSSRAARISDDDAGIARERQRHPRHHRRGPLRGGLLAAPARRQRLLARPHQPQRQQRALPGRPDGHGRLGERRQRGHAGRRLPHRRPDDAHEQYRDAAIAAYNDANGLADPMLDETQDVGDTTVRGRDLKMTAAAFLYNVTGSTGLRGRRQRRERVHERASRSSRTAAGTRSGQRPPIC